MTKRLFDYIVTAGIITLTIAALTMFGYLVNENMPWEYLTSFFVFIRRLALMMDFMIDTTLLFALVTTSYSLKIGLWGYQATMAVIAWFRNN